MRMDVCAEAAEQDSWKFSQEREDMLKKTERQTLAFGVGIAVPL